MNKLLYETKGNFKPVFYMVVMHNEYSDDWDLVNFSEAEGMFLRGELCHDPNQQGEPLQIYDYETVMCLLAHHALNSKGTDSIRIAPVYVPEVISGPSNSPYLNPYASLEGIKEAVTATASYCREIDPGGWNNAFNLPPSLGGEEVVPAIPEPISSESCKESVA